MPPATFSPLGPLHPGFPDPPPPPLKSVLRSPTLRAGGESSADSGKRLRQPQWRTLHGRACWERFAVYKLAGTCKNLRVLCRRRGEVPSGYEDPGRPDLLRPRALTDSPEVTPWLVAALGPQGPSFHTSFRPSGLSGQVGLGQIIAETGGLGLFRREPALGSPAPTVP